MRILTVNKYLFARGGAEAYAERLTEELVKLGHHVAVAGATDGGQVWPIVSVVPAYRMPAIDFHAMESTRERVGAAMGVIWSAEAKAVIEQAVGDFKPDVVHLHNYAHQLSPAIVAGLQALRVPMVYTAHDYKLICPAYHARRQGRDCFACSSYVSPLLIRDKCLHDSRPWSTVAAVESLVVRRKGWYPSVILAPSQFLAEHFRSSWLNAAEVLHVPNPVSDAGGHEWAGGGDFLLYVGRLAPEKGVSVLIDAVSQLGLRLVVAGDGPQRGQLEEQSRLLGAAVEFVGHLPQAALLRLRLNCQVQVVPSEWAENAPLAALESAVLGVPLVVANRGGLPEILRAGARGIAVEDFRAASLRNALEQVASHGDASSTALARIRRDHSWSDHLKRVTDIYDRTVAAT